MPEFGADTTTERSEGVVETAGVEREQREIGNPTDGARLLGLTPWTLALASIRRVDGRRRLSPDFRLEFWRNTRGGGAVVPPHAMPRSSLNPATCDQP